MSSNHGSGQKRTLGVALGALGVVYGDIGTSPLYSVKECFTMPHGVAPTPGNVMGIMSLVFWALFLVVVVKYLVFVMRADNRGEGGILALLALLAPKSSGKGRGRVILVLLGLFGAALLYGDGMITPAISVLSAIEGLEVATTKVHDAIIPITIAILLGLFLVQARGTAKIGAIFGPAMLLWFLSIGAMGVPWIVKHPQILAAMNPIHAVRFFGEHKGHGFLVLGSVVLCITGGEALYADMGHFGRGPIRVAWYAVVFPALLLNYFGQGALILDKGEAVLGNPFFAMVPTTFIYPLVTVATVATVIASQALISGAFSLTQQAVQLGYAPRVTIQHTSGDAEGQIYIPEVNWGLAAACVLLVMAFKESSALAAAYGIAVTGTMAITSLLFYAVARQRWQWSVGKAGALAGAFLVIDLSFFGANVEKIAAGGWFPIAVAVVIFSIMTTWRRGRAAIAQYLLLASPPIEDLLRELEQHPVPRVKGTAVFMSANPDGAPPILRHHLRHNKVLHERVVLLSVVTSHDPHVAPDARVDVTELGHGFSRVIASYGFMERPRPVEVLEACATKGMTFDPEDTSFYLGHESLVATGHSGMARWRKRLFMLLARNSTAAKTWFHLPPTRVVELGQQVEL
jgi:KUP system potassium uptake protein